jgi:hypothetical protein
MSEAANQADYATLQNTVALNEQAFALQQNTKAITDLTTTVRNAPSGFKIEPYLYDFQPAAQRPAPMAPPPLSPPWTPLNAPQLSRSVSASPTTNATTSASPAPINVSFAPGAIVVNESQTPRLTAEEVGRMVVTRIDQVRETTNGPNTTRAAALELM